MRLSFIIPLLAGVLFGTTPPARAVIVGSLELVASSQGEFSFGGTDYAGSQSNNGTVAASSQVLLGSAQTPEFRSAARLSSDEVAVNVRIDGKEQFGLTQMRGNGSLVVYSAQITSVANQGEHVFASFFLPAGFVEHLQNVELRLTEIFSVVQARIAVRSCNQGGCGNFDELFFFQASLDSSFVDERHDAQASGQAGLDVTPLLDAIFTDSGPGFLRTRHFGFEDFEGVLDLGMLSAGQTLEFEYRMFARSEGSVGFSYGIAAINDPFLFDGDTVRRHAPVTFSSVPVVGGVPEPGTAALLLVALGAAGAIKRRRGA